MRVLLLFTAALTLLTTSTFAAPDPAPASDRALTIYNQNFAVVRQAVPLDLELGVNHVTVSDITYHLEPEGSSCATLLARGCCRFMRAERLTSR